MRLIPVRRYPVLFKITLTLGCQITLASSLALLAAAQARIEARVESGTASDLLPDLMAMQMVELLVFLLLIGGCFYILTSLYRALPACSETVKTLMRKYGARISLHGAANEIAAATECMRMLAADLDNRIADNARVATQMQEHEKFAMRSLELICRACSGLADHTASEQWLSAFIEEVIDIIEAHCCSLALLDVVTSELDLPPVLGTPRIPRLLEEQPVAELANGPALRKMDADAGGKYLTLAVPVRDIGDTYGVLVLETTAGLFIEERDVRLVDAIAGLLALSLGNLLRNQRRRRLALLNERNAIAGELHDSLAQTLSYVKIQAARLQRELDRSAESRDTEQEICDELKAGLDNAYRHLRELLSAFRTNMPAGGLEQALQSVVDEFTSRAGTIIALEYHVDDVQLTLNEEFQVLQIVREAVTNVVRHARARRATISVAIDDRGKVKVRVDDNGCGLKKPDNEGHYGLLIMEERAVQLGGEFAITPSALWENGTCLVVSFLPVQSRS